MKQMVPRDPDETHRQSTALEVLFDLTFVVAVSQAALSLHHGLSEGHFADALINFPMVFFAIWWAWMSFTWFASAYDVDDGVYRLAVFVQMAGVLVLAAGVPRAFEDRDFLVPTIGYGILRVGQLLLWVRAAVQDPPGRAVALWYAGLIGVVQVGWFLRLLLGETAGFVGFLVLVVAELLVPLVSEHKKRTNWHPGHIAERYGLFTLIVLGETVLASTIAVEAAFDSGDIGLRLISIALGGLIVVFAMWWIYFDQPTDRVIDKARHATGYANGNPVVWAYGHYFIFASAAAVGAGIPVLIDHVSHHSELTRTQAGLAVAIPVAVFLLSVWVIHFSQKKPSPVRIYAVPVAVALVLACSLLSTPVVAIGIVLVGLLAVMSFVYREKAAA